MRTRIGVMAAGAALAALPSSGWSATRVHITHLRVIASDTRRPAKAPLDRRRAYSYMVCYRISGPGALRVRRRALVRTLAGTVMARIVPPVEHDEAGSYFASARIPIGRHDPRGIYVLRYVIQVHDRAGHTHRAVRAIRLRFR